MKILAHLHGYPDVHCAGAEMMAHHTFRWFVERGHEVTVLTPPQMIAGGLGEVNIEGVLVKGHWTQAQQDQWYREADIVVSHLDLSPRASAWANAAGRPMVHIIHNPSSLNVYPLEEGHVDLAVYNSYSLAMQPYRLNPPAAVLYPPVFERDYGREEGPETERPYHTLINLNDNKGGPFMGQLARLDLDITYQGVMGAYDVQHTPGSPNILITPHASDMRPVYRHTRVLLVPSHSETWGRVAIEAMWHGIPVIANSECSSPGFKEALGEAVIWAPRSDPSAWLRAIKSLADHHEYKRYQAMGLLRAKQIEDRTLFQLACMERHFATLVNKHGSGRVHFFAEEEHYLRHMSGVAHQLDPDKRGLVVVPNTIRRQALIEGHMVLDSNGPNYLARLHQFANPMRSLAYCVSYKDQMRAVEAHYQVVRAEHGSGQTYVDLDTASFAGSADHRKAFLCLYPGSHPYTEHLIRAKTPAFMVGAPILERWLPEPRRKAVGFAFHWDCQELPETRETLTFWWEEIVRILPRLQKAGFECFMHAHPRFPKAERLCQEAFVHGITWVKDRDQFLASIGILVADNTSLLFEACAHDRVAVVLNHPGYRRHVHHGLRFWTASDVGVQCDSTVELENCIVQASNRLKSDLEYRDSSLAYVYDKDRPTLRTCLYLESALDMLKQRRSGTPTVTVRAITDFDTGPGNPVPLGALRIMTAVKAKEYAAIGMIEILDEQQYREVVLRPHERDQGVWRLLTVPKDRAYKVLRADEIDGKKIKPGEILLKGDLSTESMDELQKRNSVVQYDSDRRITKERETKCASGS